MRPCLGRAGLVVLAVLGLALPAPAQDPVPGDPLYDLPEPAEGPVADPDADAEEAQRLEGEAAAEPLDRDTEEADRSADDALQEALRPGASPLLPRTPQEAIETVDGRIRLSLEEAIRIGLAHNLDIEVQRFFPWIAYENIDVAWGAYDPVFGSEFGYFSNTTPNASLINQNQAITQRGQDGRMGLVGQVPWWGASYEIGYEASRAFTNATIAALSPQIDSNVFGNVTIPLLRNLVWNQAWTTLKTSQAAWDGTREEFRTQVMDVVRNIETAYWSVIATWEQLRVAQKSLETARALLEQTRTQYEVGVVSKVEVVEAEAGVADRDFNLIVASNAYRTAEDQLVDLVFGEALRARSDYRLVTTDEPASFTAFDVDPEEALRKALVNRPELARIRAEIERRQFELKFAENQALPRLDAVLSYGRLGQTGALNPNRSAFFSQADPEQFPTGRSLGEANEDFWRGEPNEEFAARGVLSIPIGNQAATATASRTALELRQTRTRARRIEQDIVLEIRTAIRNLRSAQEGVVAAERSVAAAAEQLRAERIRLDNGESTPFNVLLRERDLVDAESGKIDALRVYRNSSTELDRAQGTILRTHGVRIEEVGALR